MVRRPDNFKEAVATGQPWQSGYAPKLNPKEASLGTKFILAGREYEVTFICGEGDNGLVDIRDNSHLLGYQFRLPWQFVATLGRGS